MRRLAPMVVLVGWVAPVWATVITFGDVDPGWSGTQADPWVVGGSLKVGDSGSGTLNVQARGVVSNTSGYLGTKTGSGACLRFRRRSRARLLRAAVRLHAR